GGGEERGGGVGGGGVGEQKAGEGLRVRHSGREPDGGRARRDAKQAGEAERQQIAALGGDERMQLVEHDPRQRSEQMRRVSGGEQQRHLLGRGEQDIGGIAALAGGAPSRRGGGGGGGTDAPAARRAARA